MRHQAAAKKKALHKRALFYGFGLLHPGPRLVISMRTLSTDDYFFSPHFVGQNFDGQCAFGDTANHGEHLIKNWSKNAR
jgi:hypothetical protein